MAHRFPEINAYGSAFGFALEAERACGDLAAAAQVLAPTPEWHEKLDEVICTHDDRVQKLTTIRQEVNEMILEPIHTLDGTKYLGTLDADPATTWPEVVEQLSTALDDAAHFHEDFVHECEQILAASVRAFKKAAKQDRERAEELRRMLG